MHEQEKQLQEQREAPNQWILNRVKWIIAQKNTLFILEHQNDTLEQLSAYLQTCMESIDHPPARVEVIGGDYIEYRFGTWQKALRSFYAGKMKTAQNPPQFKDRQIVRALYDAEQARLRQRGTSSYKGIQR